MNVKQLNQLASRIALYEKRTEAQSKLQNVASSFSNLSSNPGNDSYQQSVSAAMQELTKAMATFEALLTPRDKQLLNTISPELFFSSDLVVEIQAKVSENAATPSVITSYVQQLVDRRAQWQEHLSELKASLDAFGVGYEQPEFPSSEVGFLIPRDIFKNNYAQFIKESEVVKFIVDSASLVATGSAQEIKLSELATSDPYIVLGLDFRVVAAIGAFVTWSLSTWKQVLEVRELRNKAKQIPAAAEFADQLEGKINELIDFRVKEEVSRLMQENSRKGADLEARLARALHMLLERVERGYQVDLKLPPPVKDDPNEELLKPLRVLRNQMLFPEVNESPVLKLTNDTSVSKSKPTGKDN